MHTAAPRASRAGDAARRRITATVFVAVALGTIGTFAALTVAPLIAVALTGAATLSGLPTAAALAGTSAGAAVVSRIMDHRGRRRGLTVGFAVGAAGAMVATGAVMADAFPVFVAGMFLLGGGNSANLLARYTVADVYPTARRTTVVGWVVWAGTVGAVVGPSLVEPAGDLLAGVSLPVLAGGALIAGVGMCASAGLCSALLRPDPSDVVIDDDPGPYALPSAPAGSWRSPVVVVSLTAMVAGQFVMVLIMTMTPVHASGAGAALGAVGFIMSAHVVGMYALTPVAGWIADRIGNLAAIAIGLAFIIASALAAALVPADEVALLSLALFGLGLGWSLGFVSSSGLLAKGVAAADRARLQGGVDTAVFGAATIGSLSSGLLIATIGYGALCLLGAALIVATALVFTRMRPAVTRALAVM